MEMEKMIELIDAVSKSDLTGFKYEEDGIKLHLSKKENTCYVTENLSAPVNAVTTSAAEIKKATEGDQIPGTSAEETPVGNVVESPLVGTFYAAPSEDAPAFVKDHFPIHAPYREKYCFILWIKPQLISL